MLLNQDLEFNLKIFIDYGQKHKKKEYNICKSYIDKIIKIPVYYNLDKEVNCRNMSFICNIVSMYGGEDIEIYLGTNKDDKYKDNNRQFYDELEGFINKISINKVYIKTPLIEKTKTEILQKLNSKYYTD